MKSQHGEKANISEKCNESILHAVPNSEFSALKPNIGAQVLCDVSASTKLDTVMNSLCPVQDDQKTQSLSHEQYESSQLYSQEIANYYFSSDVGEEYTKLGGLNH